jgi:hypothetical protein
LSIIWSLSRVIRLAAASKIRPVRCQKPVRRRIRVTSEQTLRPPVGSSADRTAPSGQRAVHPGNKHRGGGDHKKWTSRRASAGLTESPPGRRNGFTRTKELHGSAKSDDIVRFPPLREQETKLRAAACELCDPKWPVRGVSGNENARRDPGLPGAQHPPTEAGHNDATPQSRQIAENLLRPMAGPHIG